MQSLLTLAWRIWSSGGNPVPIDNELLRSELEQPLRDGVVIEDEKGLRFASESSMVQAAAQYILQTEGPLLTSTPKACFERLDKIFAKEIGKEHAVSGHVLALLHNGGQIDAYMWGRQAIEAGVRVFDVLHVMEGAVQRIENARAESIFTFFAGHYQKIKNDLAGELLYPKLETWFVRHSDVALDVKGLHEKHPNEPSASVYGCSLHGLILHDFKIGFPLAAEASRSVEPTIAGPAVNVLGLVDYTDPSRREALKETIQICTTIIKQPAHLLLGIAVRTLTRMVTLDENVIVGLLEQAAETGVPEGLYSLSEFLWRNEKLLRDKDWFWPLVLHLASVKTEHKAILSNVDMMLDDWVADVNQQARAIEFIDTWISKQRSAAFASGGIESFFPSTFHRLSEQPISLCRMLSKWLLEDDSRFPLVASKLVSYLRASGLKILELNSAIIDSLTEKEIRFLVRRILGYVVGDEVQIPLIFSLVRTQNAKTRTFGYVAAVLQNQVGHDYPYQTIEYLKERAAAENEDEEIKALCKEIAADLQGRLDALNALPDLKEFRPSSVKMRRFLKERQLQMNTAIEEASKDSIWRQIATHIPLKAGRSTFQAIRGRYTNPTELKEMSHSIALPLSEISDPAGAERERRLFRRAKKDSK
jgi:hypothetical protein